MLEKDIELFKALSQSQLGRDLIDYLDRVTDSICDSREWKEGDTKESANRAAEVIKLQIRNKIVPQKQNTIVNPNEHV
jgi:hypothetical protein